MQIQSLGQEDPPGEGNGTPLQYSCLENLMDRGAWRVTVHEITKSQTRLSDLALLLVLPFCCQEQSILRSTASYSFSAVNIFQHLHSLKQSCGCQEWS